MKGIRGRATGLLVATVSTALVLSACGGGDPDEGETTEKAGSTGVEDVTLDVSLFGTMGYEESGLLDQYQEENPNVTITYESIQEEADYWTALQTQLRSGDVPDVVGLEVGRIADVTTNQGDKFFDFATSDYAGQLEQYLDWKVDASTTADGRVVGLGTDVGPMAICYRTDLLEEAGLPTDPEELGGRLSSWEDYLALGREFQANAPGKAAWTDAASGLYNSIVSTEETIYYDESGEPIWDSNPAIRDAFDMAAQAGEEGLTAKLAQFSPEWNQGFAGGTFATIACPSWMLGYIRGQAGEDATGLWNVMTMPGGMGGNWGGSYLAVPEDSDAKDEAAKLVAWLTDAERQTFLFNELGNFPSNQDAIAQVQDTTNEYFSNAAVGQIFGAAAEAAPVQILGINDGVIRTQLSNALSSVEANNVPVDKAWSNAAKDIENQAG
jgi:cellobiose transport system substrate-binding protein